MTRPEKQFFFVHIPKTAGTTFALILTRQFKWRKKLSFYSPKERMNFPQMPASQRNKYDLIYGHLPLIPELAPERGVHYFTFLRSPRERLLSGYRHIKGDGQHIIKKTINVDEYSLKDFLKKGFVKNFDNLMTRYLSNSIGKDFMAVNEKDLETAIQNFDTYFPVFGLTEHFDESLALLAHHMGWPPQYYLKENKSSYTISKSEFDEETEKLIEVCNRFDKVVYEHARKKFMGLMDEHKAAIEKGVSELRSGNEKHRIILFIRNNINLAYAFLLKKLNRL